MTGSRAINALPSALSVALVACGPSLGGAEGGGSATGAMGTTAANGSTELEVSSGVDGSSTGGSTTAGSGCPQSDLPPPFCHVAQSYGSTLEMDSSLVPTVVMPIVSPGLPARLLIYVEGELRLVDAQDFSRVHGVYDGPGCYGDTVCFLGDFDGNGVLDLGVDEIGEPIALYDGVDLGLIAVGPAPTRPTHNSENPSGWPAGAIDADGDGVDEVVTVELAHDLGIWRVAAGTLESIALHEGVMNPCAGAFLRADFDGDGTSELALPTNGVSCWDGLGEHQASWFTLKLIPSPAPESFAGLFTMDQANGGVYRATGDLDGDGMTDVVLHDYGSIIFLRSTGEGFEPLESMSWADYGANGRDVLAVVVGDVDGDGRAEVLVEHRTEEAFAEMIRLHWGGTLGGASYEFPSGFDVAHLVDLNDDGHAEIVASEIDPFISREAFIYWSQ